VAYITIPDYLCFVITRHDPVGKKVEDAVKQALKGTGVEVYSPSKIAAGAAISDSIATALRRADVVLFDISEATPNMMFEVGFAMGRGVPILLLIDLGSSPRLPSDLRGVQFLVYDTRDLRPFMAFIRRLVPTLAKSTRG